MKIKYFIPFIVYIFTCNTGLAQKEEKFSHGFVVPSKGDTIFGNLHIKHTTIFPSGKDRFIVTFLKDNGQRKKVELNDGELFAYKDRTGHFESSIGSSPYLKVIVKGKASLLYQYGYATDNRIQLDQYFIQKDGSMERVKANSKKFIKQMSRIFADDESIVQKVIAKEIKHQHLASIVTHYNKHH